MPARKPNRTLCPGSGQEATTVQGSVYPHCPVCGRDFGVAGTRRSKAQAKKGNPWQDGIPRHYVAAEEREVENHALTQLARWLDGESLSTLDLRAACHAAEREGAEETARDIGREIDDREAKDGAG